MFKFGFSETKEEKEINNGNKTCLKWFDSSEMVISDDHLNNFYDDDDFSDNTILSDLIVKTAKASIAISKIEKADDEIKHAIEAESERSDLVPAKYEGGLKIWECTYDLGKYLLNEQVDLQDKLVLDLGCGAGILGIIALLKGSHVHFQDYNAEVLKYSTIPNVLKNTNADGLSAKKCNFYSGDWQSFIELTSSKQSNEKYDIILTSETIYNPDNYHKLHEVFKQRLKTTGTGFIAGKTYYFGVGGGMRQFEDFVNEQNYFSVESVWSSEEGLQREILRLRFKKE